MNEGTEGANNSTSATTAACQDAPIESNLREWRIMADTVPGATHLRSCIPNQDALLQLRESSIGLPLVLSLSDGHGSPKCFRSNIGSRFAVSLSSQLLREVLNRMPPDADITQLQRNLSETLPAKLAHGWKEAVTADLARTPFTKEELDTLESKDIGNAQQLMEAHPTLAYGATTLTVAVSASLIIYMQLGDGAMFTVSDTGEVRKPLPDDERLLANETTSLCSPTAAHDFRLVCQSLTDLPPALIILTTDGYANSFADEAGFLQVGPDVLEMLRTEGFDAVNRNIKSWLTEATRLGSGDDCTLGIILRMDALPNAALPASLTAKLGDSSLPPAAHAVNVNELSEPRIAQRV